MTTTQLIRPTSTITVFNPVGRVADLDAAAQTAVSELGGGTLAVLDNTKPNAQLLMTEVARIVSDHVGGMQVTVDRKNSAAEGITDDMRERLAASANLIFTGSGD